MLQLTLEKHQSRFFLNVCKLVKNYVKFINCKCDYLEQVSIGNYQLVTFEIVRTETTPY